MGPHVNATEAQILIRHLRKARRYYAMTGDRMTARAIDTAVAVASIELKLIQRKRYRRLAGTRIRRSALNVASLSNL